MNEAHYPKEPKPTDIKLMQKSKVLEIHYDDGKYFKLPCEYLRVFSPSAEVRGGAKPVSRPTGKEAVNIIGIDPMGHYAIKLIFDDGHDSGIYTWETLYDLGMHQEAYWQQYLANKTAP